MMNYVTAWKKRIRGDEEKRLRLFQEARAVALHAAQMLVDAAPSFLETRAAGSIL